MGCQRRAGTSPPPSFALSLSKGACRRESRPPSFALSLSKGRPFMVRQAHHERNTLRRQPLVRPEPVEGRCVPRPPTFALSLSKGACRRADPLMVRQAHHERNTLRRQPLVRPEPVEGSISKDGVRLGLTRVRSAGVSPAIVRPELVEGPFLHGSTSSPRTEYASSSTSSSS